MATGNPIAETATYNKKPYFVVDITPQLDIAVLAKSQQSFENGQRSTAIRHESFSKYLQVFLDISYTLFFYPYSKASTCFSISSLLRAIIVGIINVAGIFGFGLNCYGFLTRGPLDSISVCFGAILIAANAFIKVLQAQLLWFSYGKFQKIIHIVANNPRMSCASPNNGFCVGVYTVYAAYFIYGLSNSLPLFKSDFGEADGTQRVILSASLTFCQTISGPFSDLAVICLIFILLQVTKSYIKSIQNNTTTPWSNIEARFDELVELSSIINSTVGVYVALLIFENIPYCSLQLSKAILRDYSNTEMTFKNMANLVVYGIYTTAFRGLSADIDRKMVNFGIWLQTRETRKRFGVSDISSLTVQIDQNKVAIRAFDMFPVTYGLLMNLSLGMCALRIAEFLR